MNDRYTFGDNDTAAAKLRRLAEIYEPVTRELLARGGFARCGIAVDLGCGAGCDIGATLDATFLRSPWRVLGSRAVVLNIPAAHMAALMPHT